MTAQTASQPNSLTIPIEKEPEVSLENRKHIRKTHQVDIQPIHAIVME